MRRHECECLDCRCVACAPGDWEPAPGVTGPWPNECRTCGGTCTIRSVCRMAAERRALTEW